MKFMLKTNKYLLLIFIFLFCFNNVFASSYISCEFIVSVKKILTKNTFKILVEKQEKKPASHQSCKTYLGKTFIIKLKNTKNLKTNQHLKLNYTYTDSLGPKGLVKSSGWKIID